MATIRSAKKHTAHEQHFPHSISEEKATRALKNHVNERASQKKLVIL